MKSLLFAACSALALLAGSAALADPQTDEANRQRQMASMQAEASRNDRANADRAFAQQQASASAARSANAGSAPGSYSSSAAGSTSSGAPAGQAYTGPQSVVDSFTFIVRTEETRPQMLARMTREAATGDSGAQYNLGRIYYTGFDGIPRDDARARNYFRQAAAGGHPASQANLGYFLIEGIGGPADRSAGLRLLRAAADGGNSFGQAQYGLALATSDARQAVRYLIPAADAGEVTAQAMLGTFYAIGEGVARDDARAIHYLQAASDQGEVGSTGQLAGMYLTGRGGTEAEGYQLLKQAAEGGDRTSQMNYGLLLVQGNGFPRNPPLGESFIRRAAVAGDAKAMMLMGDLYNDVSNGFEESETDTIYWWNRAAEAGHPEAIEVMQQVRAQGLRTDRPPAHGSGPVALTD